MAWINIGAEQLTLDVESLGEPTMWVLTPGAPVSGAVNGLQSKQILLNQKLLSVLPGPGLPGLAGVNSAHLTMPAASYGFALFANAGAPACQAT